MKFNCFQVGKIIVYKRMHGNKIQRNGARIDFSSIRLEINMYKTFIYTIECNIHLINFWILKRRKLK